MLKQKYLLSVMLLLITIVWAVENADLSPTIETTKSDAITIPKLLNYQGKLTNLAGNPVTDSTYSITFKLFTVSAGGSEFWNETQNVQTHAGILNVLLGSVSAIDAIPQNGNCYLEMQVNPNPAMTPRIRIVSSAYTYLAKKADTADYVQYADSARIATNSYKLQGKDTISLSVKFVDENQANAISNAMLQNNAVTSNKIQDGTIQLADLAFTPATRPLTPPIAASEIADTNVTMVKIQRAGAAADQVLKWTGSAWAPRNDSVGSGGPYLLLAGGIMTGPITNTGDPAITMGKGNFGLGNSNTGDWAFVAGKNDTASGDYSAIGGGTENNASGVNATVGGGAYNTASGLVATVSGGAENTAEETATSVGGGVENTASGSTATVGGGVLNIASGLKATVSGGELNTASGNWATVGGGYNNVSAADYSWSVGHGSTVSSLYSYSAALNGQTATASSQIRVGVLSKASGTFTIDHPLDPMNKILNHYIVESPEMVLIYRGSVIIGADGKAEVTLSDYFDALNENPMVQLTGIGSSDVYVAEKVNGNRFVIGGKPNIEVYWTVTGARKDPPAQITKIIMPVEQPKSGDLAGHSLDDDFLASTLKQLQDMGKAGEFSFRTAAGREKYDNMIKALQEPNSTRINNGKTTTDKHR